MVPFTAVEYNQSGLPCFDYYSDNSHALKGSDKLKGLKSVVQIAKIKGDKPLPENVSVEPGNIVKLRKGLKKGAGSGRGVLISGQTGVGPR